MPNRVAKNNNNGNGENGHSTSSSFSKTVSGQSLSNDGSVGSPSIRNEAAMETPTKLLRLNALDIRDAEANGASGSKRKRCQRAAVGGNKNVRGLRQFSMKVCKKVESKGRTSYNEVADELVSELQDSSTGVAAPDQQPQYDEKNIRRRVYDALNVLEAMDIIFRDKKEIQWNGFPKNSSNDIEVLKADRLGIRNRSEKKAVYLKELEEHYIGLQNLIQRNEQLYCSGNVPTGGVALPFILVQTRQHATVEVEISEDMQLVHFDFNRNSASKPLSFILVQSFSNLKTTPFEIHDDSYILKAMNLCEKTSTQATPMNGGKSSSSMPNVPQPHQVALLPSRHNNSGRPPALPLPGILKSHFVKNVH